ncbi:MAG: YdhR family protein [Desulfobacterales bacterium]
MMVVFKMDKKVSTEEWFERFKSSYDVIFNLPGIIFKNWWVNQEKGEWGAYYIFDSKKNLTDYINTDLWLKKIPAKYGSEAEVTIFEPGPIICKESFTEATK